MKALPLLALVFATGFSASLPVRAATDFSAAEQSVFMEDHLAGLRPPLTLHYVFRKTGTMEEAFDDKVDVALTAQPDGSCCAASPQFFSGKRAITLPPVEGAKGNPAILYFLERDIKEMQRLTKGQPNYFRKRIRMAVYQGATVRDVNLPYKGKPVAVKEFSISPYLDDPNHARFEKLINKSYVFMMSSAVPGGLYGIRTRISGASAGDAPLMVEEMLIDGAGTPSKP
ncbi:hypothetical protein WKW79_03830 [Variovorax robiniae]|uniref:Uncharacterized protein n=1 Tax=Variovorax robiniae TaxID=1836199 RepID=A0ABU8X1R6_9BURK